MQRRAVFPFSAIVGLDKLKLAIIINAINPKVGGLLIRGPKGSGKTTVVRALADILPSIKTVKNCPFNCNPYDPSNMCLRDSEHYQKGEKLPVEEKKMRVVDLPLGATEDRVVGSLDVEKAIKLGVEALEPGILAEANQNILYVDEINLLPDHIADDLLDATATGWNVVEREGISVSHPSRFMFVGTMNPEEGELRPQLLDRFPLSVGVERIASVPDRIEVVKRNIEFERSPEGFYQEFMAAQEELRNRIARARDVLPNVELPKEFLEAVCNACAELKVDGMRPDIVISKAASTLAAFQYRTVVTLDDVLVAAELALSHRTREGGFMETATSDEIRQTFLSKAKTAQQTQPQEKQSTQPRVETGKGKRFVAFIWPRKIEKPQEKKPEKKKRSYFPKRFKKIIFTLDRLNAGKLSLSMKKWRLPDEARALRSRLASVVKKAKLTEGRPLLDKVTKSLLAPFNLFFKMPRPPIGAGTRVNVGKRAETVTAIHRGRPCGWRFPHGKPRDIHLPATIRAAALQQIHRDRSPVKTVEILPEDVREKSRVYKAPMTIVLVIDVSESMLYNVEQVREAILKLHGDAYRYRDKVGIVAFKGIQAVVVQHPITNLKVVASKLLKLNASGPTPLAAGLLKAREVLNEAKRRDKSTIPVMIIVTDGETNIPLNKNLRTDTVRKLNPIDIALKKYEDLAIDDVVWVSDIVRKEGIYTVVVNTNPAGWYSSGMIVTKLIAKVTNGIHHEVGRIFKHEQFVNEMFEALVQDERIIAHKTSSN